MTLQQVFDKLNDAHKQRFTTLTVGQRVKVILALNPPITGTVSGITSSSLTIREDNGSFTTLAWIEIIEIHPEN